MSSEREPHDRHVYDWVSFNSDTFHFYQAAIQFYESVLNGDVAAIENDPDLAFLLGEQERSQLEIHQELKRVVRARTWIKEKIEKQGTEAWGYEVSLSHDMVRFLKSVGLLYLQHLKNRRNVLASKPRISKYALIAVDQQISYFEEKTEIGIFKRATPMTLLLDDVETEEKEQSIVPVVTESSAKRPRPVFIDSIEILDPELRTRCLDLFSAFQRDGQYERLDTVVTEATRILEDKLRSVSGASANCIGVDLAAFALGGKEPRLIVSEITSEQESAHLLFRGVFGFIRNQVHHRLVENLLPERVLQIVGMVDYLISVAQGSSRVAIDDGVGG